MTWTHGSGSRQGLTSMMRLPQPFPAPVPPTRASQRVQRTTGSWAGARAALMSLVLLACGESPVNPPPPSTPPPTRTATQDDALRRLMLDIAANRACEALEGRFVPLPENRDVRPSGVLPLADGRLWTRRCEATRQDDSLRVTLSGRGWQWVEQSRAGPLGSRFTVRGTVRFDAALQVEGQLDVRYDSEQRLAMVLLTPSQPPAARVTPLGTVPVAPDGGWSGLVAGLGGLLGMDPQTQARQLLEAEAGATLERELARGLTFSLDLCNQQPDVTLGALADGERPPPHPYPEDGRTWLDNSHGRVRAGGLDLSGPWGGGEAPLRVDAAIERGQSMDVTLLCEDDATALAASYLATGVPAAPSGLERRTITASASGALELRSDRCAAPYVLLTTDDPEVRYRIRVRRERPPSEGILDCSP